MRTGLVLLRPPPGSADGHPLPVSSQGHSSVCVCIHPSTHHLPPYIRYCNCSPIFSSKSCPNLCSTQEAPSPAGLQPTPTTNSQSLSPQRSRGFPKVSCSLRPPGRAHRPNLSQVPSLLCPQPSMAPTFLRAKAQALPSAHKVLHDLPIPSLPSPPPSLPLAHYAPVMEASSLFLQHTRHSPAPGLLHALCSLPPDL